MDIGLSIFPSTYSIAAPASPGELEKLPKQAVVRVMLPLPTQEESKLLVSLDSFAPLIANAPARSVLK